MIHAQPTMPEEAERQPDPCRREMSFSRQVGRCGANIADDDEDERQRDRGRGADDVHRERQPALVRRVDRVGRDRGRDDEQQAERDAESTCDATDDRDGAHHG